MKKTYKYLLSLIFVISVAFIPTVTFAITDIDLPEIVTVDPSYPWETALTLLRVTMLGLVVIVSCVILIAGFKWIMAGNDKLKFRRSVKLMIFSFITLIILIIAFNITKYIIKIISA